jgi:hypothetical protein
VPFSVLKQIQQAVSTLNPKEVLEQAARPVRLNLYASSAAGYEAMEEYFYGEPASPQEVVEAKHVLHRAGDLAPVGGNSIDVYEELVRHPRNAFVFSHERPELVVKAILKVHRDELGIALARHLIPFRRAMTQHIISRVSRENALFSVATAVPDVLPILSLPWAVGEFASDTAFLTMNQIRMAFLLAAVANREVGYREQKGEVASIVTGAFGWRAIARELVGKIPLGGGLIPKAAIAYAGTYVVGKGIARYHQFGRHLSRREQKRAYAGALEKGRHVAGELLAEVRTESRRGAA